MRALRRLGGEVVAAGHQPHELVSGRRAALERCHGLARPHDRAAIADLGDLVHPVRDEDHRGAGLGALAQEREQAVAGGDVEGRRRLVEDEDARVAHERAGEAARLPLAEGQPLRRACRAEATRRAARRAPAWPGGASRRRGHVRRTRRRSPSRRSRAPSAARRRAPPGRRWRCRPPRRAGASGGSARSPPRARACRRRAGERRRGSSRAWTCRTRSRRRRSGPHRGAARTSTSAAPASARTPWRARSCAVRSRSGDRRRRPRGRDRQVVLGAGMDRRPPPPRMTCASEPERKF